MVQLQIIRERITWQLVAIIAVFLLTIVIAVAFLLPARSNIVKLQAQITELEKEEESLNRIVRQKPVLEEREREIALRVRELGAGIPTQYDLPQVMEVLAQLRSFYGLTLEKLDHVPLNPSDNQDGVIPILLTISGKQTSFAYIQQLQDLFPSMNVTSKRWDYQGRGIYEAKVWADLNVFLVARASASQWELPFLRRTDPVAITSASFGLPFRIVKEYFPGKIDVIGLVQGGRGAGALLLKDSERQWINVGGRLDDATLSSVVSDGVWLNIDGVPLKLTIGS